MTQDLELPPIPFKKLRSGEVHPSEVQLPPAPPAEQEPELVGFKALAGRSPRTAKDALRDIIENPEEQIGFVKTGRENLELLRITDLALKGDRTPEEEQELVRYLEGPPRSTFAAQVIDLVGNLLPMAQEFAVSGPIAAGSKKALGLATKEIVEDQVGREFKKSLLGKALEGAKDAAERTLAMEMVGSLVGGGRVQAETWRAALPDMQLSESEAGKVAVVFPATAQSFLEALPVGFAAAFTEVASEKTGDFLLRVTGLQAAQSMIMRSWMKRTGGSADEFLQTVAGKAGWHGPLGEFLEERASGLGEAVTPGREGFGKLETIFPGLEAMAAELVAFSVPGAARAGMSRVDVRRDLTGSQPPQDESPIVPGTQPPPELTEIGEKVSETSEQPEIESPIEEGEVSEADLDVLLAEPESEADALAGDVATLQEEQRWMRAVTTPGQRVRLKDGSVAEVVEGAEDPVNGTGEAGEAVVRDAEGEELRVSALALEPAFGAAVETEPLPEDVPRGTTEPPEGQVQPAEVEEGASLQGSAAELEGVDPAESASQEVDSALPDEGPAPQRQIFDMQSGGVGTVITDALKKLADVLIPERTAGVRGENFDLVGETTGQFIRRFTQDRLIRFGEVQKQLKKQGGNVREASDVARHAELFEGKVEDHIRRAESRYIKPIEKAIQRIGISFEEAGKFLMARHAERRNSVIADRDPQFDHDTNPGSGMRTGEARAILTDASQSEQAEDYERLGARFDALNRDRIRLAVSSGLMNRGEAAEWKRIFGENYAPLRDEVDPKRLGFASPRGFSVKRGSLSERATGRGADNLAANPLAWALVQFNETAIQAEKNQVGRSMKRLAEENPDNELWNVRELPKKEDQDPAFKVDENHAMTVKVNGKQFVIEFADPLMARAMMNLAPKDSNAAVRVLGIVSRYFSTINTSLDPEFIISNLLRDLQTAGIHVSVDESNSLARKVIAPKAIAKNVKAIWRVLRDDKNAQGESEKWFREFRAEGGKVGWFHAPSFSEQVKKLEQRVEDINATGARAAYLGMLKIGEVIEHANTAVENGVRLSLYIELRKQGRSKAEAASAAKNLTVNFNRKGEWGTAINALYMFANAGIQGSAAMMMRVTKSKKARHIAEGIVALGFLEAFLNHALSGDDDDGDRFYEKVPDWVRERNIVIMLPEYFGKVPAGKLIGRIEGSKKGQGYYLKLPLPYGYSFFRNIGRNVSDVRFGSKSGGEATKSVFSSMVDSFSPVSVGGSVAQTLSPTIGDPVVQIAENKTFWGGPVKPDHKGFGPPPPESERFFPSINPAFKETAQFINRFTGGDEFKEGAISISPEDIELIYDTVAGGPGRLGSRLTKVIKSIGSDEPLPINNMPFVRRLAGGPDEWYVQSKYFDNLDDLRRFENRVKQAERDGNPRRAAELRQSPMWSMVQSMKVVERRRKAVRGDDAKVDELQRTFNKRYKERIVWGE